MLELKKRELKIKLYGEKFDLEFPTAKRMNDFMIDIRRIIKGELDKDDYTLTCELLVESGLPKDKVEELYNEDIKEIIKIFDGQKKI